MKFTFILLAFLFVFLTAPGNAAKAQSTDVNDSMALVDLYNSTDGAHWSYEQNWLNGPVNTWSGITVTGARVTAINLYGKNLNGALPLSIGNLTALVTMELGSNSLRDSIPFSIGNLASLQSIDLYSNQLNGAIPASITNLTNLTYLNISFNGLTGEIPASIDHLINLTYLTFAHNFLSGSIPFAAGNLINLTDLYLNNNQLSGAIPAAIGNLAKLQYLYLFNNQLSGAIPPTISQLSQLKFLELYYNQLSGAIPFSIGKLANLSGLLLYNNQLSGAIPASVGNLSSLFNLDVSNNMLTGSIPSSIGNITSLFSLKLSGNRLSGAIPFSIGKITGLYILYLNANALTGSIPASFNKIASLGYLDVSNNYLTENENVDFVNVPYPNVNAKLLYNNFTFNGLEFLAKNYPYSKYAHQAPVHIHQHGNALSVYAGGTLSNNTYKWFAAGKAGYTAITGDSVFTPAQTGKYYAQITNTIATQLTLTTDTVTYVAPLATKENNLLAEKPVEMNNVTHTFSAYPNPANTIIRVQVKGNTAFVISNIAGKILLVKDISNSGIISVSGLASGVYYMQNKTTGEVKKIIVKH